MTEDSQEDISVLRRENTALLEQVKQLKTKLDMSNAAFLNIVGKSLDGIVILDEGEMVVYANYAAMSLFNRNIADLLGEPLSAIVDPAVLRANDTTPVEVKIPHAEGVDSIAEVSVLRTEWNNRPAAVVSFRDITERKKTQALLEHMSHHDFLTDLPNRVYFEKRLLAAMQDADQYHYHMALLYLDLDNFKRVNDTWGHDVGDLLLKQVSDILKKSIRKEDSVARLGGDEFALILCRLRKPEYAESVAKSLLNHLNKVFKIDGKEIFTNASIGIAIYPAAGKTAVELVKNADTAMYAAKEHGKNQYRVYSEDFNKGNEEYLSIVNGLRMALRQEEFFLMYQPIVNLKKNKCAGVEALLRWKHPHLGLIPPDRFLPLAQEAGMMTSIGRWVIQKALADYRVFSQGLDLYISINMSANDLDGAKTAEIILENIKEAHVETKNLVLELTETSIMQNPEASIDKFNRLAEIGVQIAVDDYGTGYSSLNYLKRLPISLLKIDKSFVDDINLDENNTIIVTSTIQLAHNLGLKVIAEGVETKEQFEFLKKHSCDYIQGFYFSKPLVLEDLIEFLKNCISRYRQE